MVRIQSILAASERISACLLAAEDLTADLGPSAARTVWSSTTCAAA